MERRNLPKADSLGPNLSVEAFTRRSKTLAADFSSAVGLPIGELALIPEIANTAAVMALAGRASEVIARNRGPAHRVVPICTLADEVVVWTGYRESWNKLDAEKNFRFVESGFTLHVGRKGELSKPQILRSEWVGPRSSTFNNQAGHPHWQLDILESARTDQLVARRFGDPESARMPLDFSEQVSFTNENLIFGLTVERMHLASAALWWKRPNVPVSHAPESITDIDSWALRCIAYLRQEASRCVILPVNK